MAPEKFENNVKKVLQEREIAPTAEAWDRLEQRLEQKKGASKPYFWWVSAAAAIAVVFFLLGSYFNTNIPSETPQIVEETPEMPILEEKTTEPEVLQVAAQEVEEIQEETSAETPVKNDIFEPPVSEAPEEEILIASQDASGAIETTEENIPLNELLVEDIKTEIAVQDFSSEVSDSEIEALLLLATAELKADRAPAVSADHLLHEVEYELEQSFRQKVFEVVKENLLKAKTAVANRDF